MNGEWLKSEAGGDHGLGASQESTVEGCYHSHDHLGETLWRLGFVFSSSLKPRPRAYHILDQPLWGLDFQLLPKMFPHLGNSFPIAVVGMGVDNFILFIQVEKEM
jgi:hypothetical protein